MENILLSKRLNPENFVQRKKDNETFFFPETQFSFLNDHFGLRPGKVHMFLGPTGGGKTSLVRSIINRMCQTHKVLLIATEESVNDLETTSSYALKKINHDNFFVVEENQILNRCSNTGDIKNYLHQVEWELELTQADILVFDNFTTSKPYLDIKLSADFFSGMKRLASSRNMPFITVCHTENSVQNGVFFEANNIRGSKFAAINSEYLYCLMRFPEECNGHTLYMNFVYVAKARTHDNIKEAYRVWFDPQFKEYTSSEKRSITEFLDIAKTKRK